MNLLNFKLGVVLDKTNREKDLRGKFIKDVEDLNMTRPLTDFEKKLIEDFERKRDGKKEKKNKRTGIWSKSFTENNWKVEGKIWKMRTSII